MFAKKLHRVWLSLQARLTGWEEDAFEICNNHLRCFIADSSPKVHPFISRVLFLILELALAKNGQIYADRVMKSLLWALQQSSRVWVTGIMIGKSIAFFVQYFIDFKLFCHGSAVTFRDIIINQGLRHVYSLLMFHLPRPFESPLFSH